MEEGVGVKKDRIVQKGTHARKWTIKSNECKFVDKWLNILCPSF